jgi:peptide/nickel transport system permease protein
MTVHRLLSRPSLFVGSLIVLIFLAVALTAPLLAPRQGELPFLIPRDGFVKVPQPPGPSHPLGTMEAQNDIFYGLVWGARFALRLSLLITAGRAFLGILVGLFSGYYGRGVDAVLMRLTDAFLSFPVMVAVMVTVTLLGHDTYITPEGFVYPMPNGPRAQLTIGLTLVAFGWMSYARLVRGNILSEREQEYIAAARSIGMRHWRILFRHLLPNTTRGLPVLIASDIGMVVVWLATFHFVGLIPANVTMMLADWGQMLAFARHWIVGGPGRAFEYWYTYLPVSAAIVLYSVGWNLIGDGLRDALDPRLR